MFFCLFLSILSMYFGWICLHVSLLYCVSLTQSLLLIRWFFAFFFYYLIYHLHLFSYLFFLSFANIHQVLSLSSFLHVCCLVYQPQNVISLSYYPCEASVCTYSISEHDQNRFLGWMVSWLKFVWSPDISYCSDFTLKHVRSRVHPFF